MQYFIAGIRPVYFERRSDGMVLRSFKFSWETGEFVKDDEYWIRIIFGRIDELEEVSEAEFRRQVERLRKERGLVP